MLIGIQNIEATQYGMPALHMEALQQAAAETGAIGIRPVSKFALTYLEEGNPTKPFNVKNKSSNIGPAAGLISIDSRYGRLPTLSEREKRLPPDEREELILEKLRIQNKNYQDDINKAHQEDQFSQTNMKLKEIPLKITPSRLNVLVEFEIIKLEELSDSTYKYKISWGDEDHHREAYVKAEANTDLLSIYDSNNQPVNVLGRSVPGRGEKAITADYDFLVVCPLYKDFEPAGIDKTPFSTQGDLKKTKAEIDKSKTEPDPSLPSESATGGNWSQRIQDAVKLVNKKINELDPLRNMGILDTVHHNAEFNNPFADDIKNNMPCLFALPKPMDLSPILIAGNSNATPAAIESAKSATIVLIETPKELDQLRNIMRDQGYYWPAHARYAKTIPAFRPEAIVAAEAAIAIRVERSASSTSLIFQNLTTNPKEVLQSKAEQPASPRVDNVALVEFNPRVFLTSTKTQEQDATVSATVKPFKP